MNKPLRFKCPCCQKTLEWDSSNPYRPFCSAVCKNKDFVAWANEDNIIAGNAQYDDLLSDDVLADQLADRE